MLKPAAIHLARRFALFCLLVLSATGCAPGDEPPTTPPRSTPIASLTAIAPSDEGRRAGTPVSPAPARPAGDEVATVAFVVDGDTIEVTLDGRPWRVRFILVDTPEVYGDEDCFGRQASARTKALLPPGMLVRLERDVTETDRYGRLLRYVYLPDGRMLNELLVAEGYARVATFPPDVRHIERVRTAEVSARRAKAGLWAACPAS